MKLRIRQLMNDQWIVERRRWFRWTAVWVVRSMTTRAGAEAGRDSLPMIYSERPGDSNYPMTWHATREQAVETWREVKALQGESA